VRDAALRCERAAAAGEGSPALWAGPAWGDHGAGGAGPGAARGEAGAAGYRARAVQGRHRHLAAAEAAATGRRGGGSGGGVVVVRRQGPALHAEHGGHRAPNPHAPPVRRPPHPAGPRARVALRDARRAAAGGGVDRLPAPRLRADEPRARLQGHGGGQGGAGARGAGLCPRGLRPGLSGALPGGRGLHRQVRARQAGRPAGLLSVLLGLVVFCCRSSSPFPTESHT
jgi:hypothetical protein